MTDKEDYQNCLFHDSWDIDRLLGCGHNVDVLNMHYILIFSKLKKS